MSAAIFVMLPLDVRCSRDHRAVSVVQSRRRISRARLREMQNAAAERSSRRAQHALPERPQAAARLNGRDQSIVMLAWVEPPLRLMLVGLCLLWGVTWPLMKIALSDIPPLSMRTLTAGANVRDSAPTVSPDGRTLAYATGDVGFEISRSAAQVRAPAHKH